MERNSRSLDVDGGLAHAAGEAAGDVDRISRLCDGLVVRYPDERFAAEYGRLLARTRASWTSVGTMDLRIATAAVLDGALLVTRNARRFSKVPDLTIDEY